MKTPFLLRQNRLKSSFMSCWMMKCFRETKLFLPTWKSTWDLDEFRPTSMMSSLMSSMLSLLMSRPIKLWKLAVFGELLLPVVAVTVGAAAGVVTAAGALILLAGVTAMPAPLLSF